jgi:hypothetical protein
MKLIAVCVALSLTVVCESSSAKQSMTLAEKKKEGFVVVRIDCDQEDSALDCLIVGSRIFKSEKKLFGAVGRNPNRCYLQASFSKTRFTLVDGTYVYSEGPGGSCQTKISSTIDFKSKTYTYESNSEVRSGIFCEAQTPESHFYTLSAMVQPLDELKCDGLEAIDSLWFP